MRWSSTEITGTRTARGSGSGSRVTCGAGPWRRALRLDGSHGKLTLSSGNSPGPGGAHDHTRRGRHDRCRPDHRRRGRAPAATGTYPVTNPARPAEVVLEAPATSPEQLDRAVAAARRSQPAWAALAMEERAALVMAAAEAGVAARRGQRPGPLLTREHGKIYFEAALRRRHHGRHGRRLRPAGGRRAGARGAERRRHHASSGSPTAWWPPILPFNWPVSVMANKILPGPARRRHRGRQGAAHLPGHGAPGGGRDGRRAARRRPQRGERPGRRARRGAGRPPRHRHGLVHRRCRHRSGRHGRRGGNDPARRARARRQRRRHPGPRRRDRRRAGRPPVRRRVRHQRAGLHGDQAALRPPRPDGRDGRGAGRRLARRGRRRRAGRGGDDGARAHRSRRGTGWRPSSQRPRRPARPVHAARPLRDEDEGGGRLLRLARPRGGAAGRTRTSCARSSSPRRCR